MKDGDRADAADLRRETGKLGYVIRSEGQRQYWRPQMTDRRLPTADRRQSLDHVGWAGSRGPSGSGPARPYARASAGSSRAGSSSTRSGEGTSVDLTVRMASAASTASAMPSSEKGKRVCISCHG